MTAGQRTKLKILKTGLMLWPEITLANVAKASGLTHPAILYHFPDKTLKDEIAKYAVEIGYSRVIVQLIASKHNAVKKMSEAEKKKHFRQYNAKNL